MKDWKDLLEYIGAWIGLILGLQAILVVAGVLVMIVMTPLVVTVYYILKWTHQL